MISQTFVGKVKYSVSEVAHDDLKLQEIVNDSNIYIVFYEHNDFITLCYSENHIKLTEMQITQSDKYQRGSFKTYLLNNQKHIIAYVMFRSLCDAIECIADDQIMKAILFNLP